MPTTTKKNLHDVAKKILHAAQVRMQKRDGVVWDGLMYRYPDGRRQGWVTLDEPYASLERVLTRLAEAQNQMSDADARLAEATRAVCAQDYDLSRLRETEERARCQYEHTQEKLAQESIALKAAIHATLIEVRRSESQDAQTVAAQAAREAETKLTGNLRWYGASGPAFREAPTADGRGVRVIEPNSAV